MNLKIKVESKHWYQFDRRVNLIIDGVIISHAVTKEEYDKLLPGDVLEINTIIRRENV